MAFYMVKAPNGDIVAKCRSLYEAIKKAETQHNFKKIKIHCLDTCEYFSLDEARERFVKKNFKKLFLPGGAPGSGKRR